MAKDMVVTTKQIEAHHLWHTARFPLTNMGWKCKIANSTLTYDHVDKDYIYYTDLGDPQVWGTFQIRLAETEGEENE